MAFQFKNKHCAAKNVRKAVLAEIDGALALLADPEVADDVKTHETRKCCKVIRGIIRLPRPHFDEYHETNAWVRDLSRTLSSFRDATVQGETLESLKERFVLESGDLNVYEVFLERIRAAQPHLEAREERNALEEVQPQLARLRERVCGWRFGVSGFALVGDGLQHTYARGREAFGEARSTQTEETFHEWRKEVKYLRYQVNALKSLWPEILDPWHEELVRLSDFLGDEHDLSVLLETLRQEESQDATLQPLRELAERRQQELRQSAGPLGLRLYAEKPKHFRRRFRHYWRAWRKDC